VLRAKQGVHLQKEQVKPVRTAVVSEQPTGQAACEHVLPRPRNALFITIRLQIKASSFC